MSINRIHKKDSFAQIPNATLRDSRLSYLARGILAMVLTHSGDWDIDKDYIESNGTEGDIAITSAFRELEALGYRRVERSRDAQGRITTLIHWFEDAPVPAQPVPGNPGPGDPGSNRTPPKNTIPEHSLPTDVGDSPLVGGSDEPALVTTTPTETVTEPWAIPVTDGFEEFWRAYPRKERQVVAKAAYDHALTVTDHKTLLRGAQGYARKVTRDKTEARYIQTADRWLREERWTDDYSEPRRERPWWGTADD